MLPTDNKFLQSLQRILTTFLWLSLALIFLYSAYSKLFLGFDFHKSFFRATNNFFLDAFIIDVDAFDHFRWTFLDIGINSMLLAGVLARLMIGFEFMLGFLLLFRIQLKKITHADFTTLISCR